MYITYIIQSEINERYYIGQTNDIEKRLMQHNAGESFATQPYIPRKLVYKKEFETRSEAMRHERYLKSLKNKNYLKELITTAG